MIQITILENDVRWYEPIGQGEQITHLAKMGDVVSVTQAEADRLLAAGKASIGQTTITASASIEDAPTLMIPDRAHEEAPPAKPAKK